MMRRPRQQGLYDGIIRQQQHDFLEPGFIDVSSQATVRTVVGSCVAVCRDRKLRYGGMNHFIRPMTHIKQEATPKYGNVAVAALVRIMEDAGCAGPI